MGGVGGRRNVAQRIEELEALLGVTSYESERELTYSDEEHLEVCEILREAGQLEAVLSAQGLSPEELEGVLAALAFSEGDDA